jgi:hypothetical protein
MELWGGSLYNYGNNYVYGNTQLGNAASDTLTIYPGTIAWGAGGDSDFCIDVDTNDKDSGTGICWDHDDLVAGNWYIDDPVSISAVLTVADIHSTIGGGDFADNNITNVGDIALDSLSSDGTTISITPSDWLLVSRNSSANNSVDSLLYLKTSYAAGAGAAGLGAALVWQIENASSGINDAAWIEAVQTTATAASETSKLDFYLDQAGTRTLGLTVKSAAGGVVFPGAIHGSGANLGWTIQNATTQTCSARCTAAAAGACVFGFTTAVVDCGTSITGTCLCTN